MKKHGWAVYYGLQTQHVDVVGTLLQDIRELLNRPKTITGVSWYDAQDESKNENGSGGMKLKISMEYLANSSQANSYFQSIISFFHKVEKNYCNVLKDSKIQKLMKDIYCTTNEKLLNKNLIKISNHYQTIFNITI